MARSRFDTACCGDDAHAVAAMSFGGPEPLAHPGGSYLNLLTRLARP